MTRRLALLLSLLMAITATAAANPFARLFSAEEAREHAHKEVRLASSDIVPTDERVVDAPCVDGMAADLFPCDGVDLLSFVPLDEFRGNERLAVLGGGTSDLWGWTDPETDEEYVLLGKTNGTAFFNVTDPLEPVYLGDLPNTSAGQLIWHDIKIYDDHAFIVSESPGHGMRVFDLTRLRGETEPQTWTQDSHYPFSFSSHNIAINTETGYAYIVGGNAGLVVPDQCLSGLHMVDLSNPLLPTFAGCHSTGEGAGTAGLSGVTAYIHDTQCVNYHGPDEDFQGRELCFNSSEEHMSIVDVTDKANPEQVGLVEYPDVAYAHQGWLTEDHAYFMMGDELDEGRLIENTRTLLFDVTDIDAPSLLGEHLHETTAIDHNMYVKDGLVYQSNYAAGLRVLDTAPIAEGRLDEVAYFDSYPDHDEPQYVGSWSNYPYFPSGTIAFSGIDEGLFLVRLHDDVRSELDTDGPGTVPGEFGRERAAQAQERLGGPSGR